MYERYILNKEMNFKTIIPFLNLLTELMISRTEKTDPAVLNSALKILPPHLKTHLLDKK